MESQSWQLVSVFRWVYNEMELTDEGVIIDIVYAIYKENDLEGTQEK